LAGTIIAGANLPIKQFPLSDWLDNVALGALSSRETVQASYDIARVAIESGVPGDFVECGVYNGSQAAAMARAIIDSARFGLLHHKRWVHLFDTFAGIPQAGPHDAEFLASKHPEGIAACSIEAVAAHMAEWGLPDALFTYHTGLLSGSAAWARYNNQFPKGIAVLRLDVDLYESTRDCMEHLYPLVNLGGWIIVDDWNLSGARKAVEEVVQPGPIYFQKPRGA
jgi:hypothetical protein